MRPPRILLAILISLFCFTSMNSQQVWLHNDLLRIDTSIKAVSLDNVTTNTKLESILVQNTGMNTKLTKLDSLEIKTPSVSAVATDKALVVDQRPTTATFGTNTPTVTAYTTASNTIITTNCITIVLENVSVTTSATFQYGGISFTLGYKNNPNGYPTTYTFTMPYDWPSKKYSPFPTLVLSALGSQVALTKYFVQ